MHRAKPASEQELALYCYVGEAVSAIQHLEDALSHSLVLKIDAPPSRTEADELLERHRSYTLGKAIKFADEYDVYDASLQDQLKTFLKERNWLIHRSIAQSRDDWDRNVSRNDLIRRIRSVTTQAIALAEKIESDLIEFAEANGKDMSRVRAAIEQQANRN